MFPVTPQAHARKIMHESACDHDVHHPEDVTNSSRAIHSWMAFNALLPANPFLSRMRRAQVRCESAGCALELLPIEEKPPVGPAAKQRAVHREHCRDKDLRAKLRAESPSQRIQVVSLR